MAKLSKMQIEKKYDCAVHMDWIDGFRFYAAFANTDGDNEPLFGSASGWNLDELVECIEDNLYDSGEK